MFHGFTDTDPFKFFEKSKTDITRNSENKIFIKDWRTKKIKNVYSYRVAPYWNALTPAIKNAQTTNQFKNLLDGNKIWAMKLKEIDVYGVENDFLPRV